MYLLYYVCIAVSTLHVRLLARSQYPEGPATGHLHKGFSWFPYVYKRTLRWFPRPQVATACFSCSPHDLHFLDPYFIFMYMHYNHCHRVTAHLQLDISFLKRHGFLLYMPTRNFTDTHKKKKMIFPAPIFMKLADVQQHYMQSFCTELYQSRTMTVQSTDSNPCTPSSGVPLSLRTLSRTHDYMQNFV